MSRLLLPSWWAEDKPLSPRPGLQTSSGRAGCFQIRGCIICAASQLCLVRDARVPTPCHESAQDWGTGVAMGRGTRGCGTLPSGPAGHLLHTVGMHAASSETPPGGLPWAPVPLSVSALVDGFSEWTDTHTIQTQRSPLSSPCPAPSQVVCTPAEPQAWQELPPCRGPRGMFRDGCRGRLRSLRDFAHVCG